MQTVERCELAPGFHISRVLTGLWQIADMERDGRVLDREATAAAMAPYVKAGLTTFDMADHYGSAEEIAGLFRERHPGGGEAQLLTKWVPQPGPLTRDDVRTAVHRSLDRLRTDCIDLLQFHAWSYADAGYLDCLFHLQELKQEGLVRHLGLTNFDAAHLRVAVQSGIEVVSNQVCFSVIDRRPLTRMSEFCLQEGIKLLAYGTLAGGFLTDRYVGEPEPDRERLDTWSKMKYRRFIDAAGGWNAFQDVMLVLDRVARRHEVSVANIACRYVLEQPAVGGIIIGARLGRSEHVRESLRLFRFSLDETSRCEIDEALSALQRIPGDCGDEYRKAPFLTASGDLS